MTEGTPIYAGEAAGYIFDNKDGHTLYHSGDTAVTYDIKIIQNLYKPNIAILSSSGHFTMGPEEAAYVVKNFLDIDYVIPSHTFPTKETVPAPKALENLLVAFPIVGTMMDKDQNLETLLKGYPKTKVIVMGYGEEREFCISKK